MRYTVVIPKLALSFMNEDHRAELDLAEAAAAAAVSGDRPKLLESVGALANHTREHFAREEEVMRAVGFPAYPVHKAEHDRVLAELAEWSERLGKDGDSRRLLAHLDGLVRDWFPEHIATMDTVTAHFASGRGRS
jgi:hemerythrin